jgi:hypothetical protein
MAGRRDEVSSAELLRRFGVHCSGDNKASVMNSRFMHSRTRNYATCERELPNGNRCLEVLLYVRRWQLIRAVDDQNPV